MLAAICIVQAVAIVVVVAMFLHREKENALERRALILRADGKPMPNPDRPAPAASPRPVPLGDDARIVALQRRVNGGEGI